MSRHTTAYIQTHLPSFAKRYLFQSEGTPPGAAPEYKRVTQQPIEATTKEMVQNLMNDKELIHISTEMLLTTGKHVFDTKQGRMRHGEKETFINDSERAFYTIGAIESLPVPQPGDIPEPVRFAPGNELTLPVNLAQNGDIVVLDNLQTQSAIDLRIISMNGRTPDGQIQCICSLKRGNATEMKLLEIPTNTLIMAQLRDEQQAITDSHELTEPEKATIKATLTVLNGGNIDHTEAQKVIAEGSKAAGILTRSTIESFAQQSGVTEADIRTVLGSSVEVSSTQMMSLLDKAQLFNPERFRPQAEAATKKVADLGKQIADQQTAVGTLESDIVNHEALIKKTEGEQVHMNGQTITVSEHNITRWQNELDGMKQKLPEAQLQLQQLSELLESAQMEEKMLKQALEDSNNGVEARSKVENLLKDMEQKKLPPEQRRALVSAFENNNMNGVFDLIMTRELQQIKDENERNKAEKKLQARREKMMNMTMKAGGAALVIMFLLMSSALKEA
ncbi:MAG: hypothetical protein ACOCXQ_02490 [Patescibacteria group bacterium]